MSAVIKNARTQRAKRRGRGNVRTAQLRAKTRLEPDSHGTPGALHHHRIAVEPESIGQPGQQRRDGNVDAAAGQVCPHVRGERTPVDRNGDRRFGWE